MNAAMDNEVSQDGFLDEASPSLAKGWAVSQAGSAPLLTLRVGGEVFKTFLPSIERADLQGRFGTTLLGFEIPISVGEGAVIAVTDQEGNHLHGSPAIVRLSNLEKLLSRAEKQMRILEVGPGYRPLVPKREGWNSYSIDHAARDELVKKYASHGQPIHQIEEVDFLWRDGPIETAVPREMWGSFDACIASHLIEHIPNPIGFYLSMSMLLAPKGSLLLIVPDKRYIFDFFKPLSTTSQLIDAFKHKRVRHTKATAFDNVNTNCRLENGVAWNDAADLAGIHFVSGKGISEGYQAYEHTDEAAISAYVDFHGWTYTPASFALSVLETNALGLHPFVIEKSYPTFGCEFYAALHRGSVEGRDLTAERLALNKQIVMELGAQAEQLRKSEARS
jgi:SAM-dependent methyltransferase